YFDQQNVSGANVYWRLIDPNGQQVWFNSFGDMPTQKLSTAGTYTLLVEGYILNPTPISFSFNAYRVTNVTAPLTVGSVIDGAVAQPGQTNSYTFNLANASQLYFDSLTNDSSLIWTLTGPRGLEVNSRAFTSDAQNFGQNPILSLIAGDYTLA